MNTCFTNTASVGNDRGLARAAGYSSTLYFNGPAPCAAATATGTFTVLPVLYLTQSATAYTLPATPGTTGQVLTQQAGGVVAF